MTRNLYKMYDLNFLMLGVLDTINKSKPTIVSDIVINDIDRLSFEMLVKFGNDFPSF